MKKRKHKQKSGMTLSLYFKKLKIGDRVAVNPALSVPFFLPKRIIGLTGIIVGERGRDYIIEVKEMGKVKKFIIGAAHLKKIKA